MNRLLYITDQDEYTDHSFIGPLFEKHLNNYIHTDIVYFSEFKTELEKKDDRRFVLPKQEETKILNLFENAGISPSEYDYIIVRNNADILKAVLQQSKTYNYKVGYRLSFPKDVEKMEVDKANNKSSFLKYLNTTINSFSETKYINQCDIFLPSSDLMKEEYYEAVKVKTFICPPCLDPDELKENKQHQSNEKRFFYAGTIDKLRDFETVINAFDSVKSSSWKLTISTKNPENAKAIISSFPTLENKINIVNAKTKEELLKYISEADVGICVLPDIPLFSTSTPIKIMDYYSTAIPCLMTNNANNYTLFTDDYDAWFCKFDKYSIKTRLEEIIDLSKEEVKDVGKKGQTRLLEIRNYKKVASKLAETLELL